MLSKLALDATRGPWRHTRQGVIVAGPFRQYTNGAAQSQIASFCVTSHEEDDEHQTEKQVPNALFSAAACPDVVLALIDRAEFAQKQWDNWVASANEWKERAEKAEAESAHKQSIIDRLMMEYCPDEMTVEQMAEWASHQKRAE
jgi:hypothetical protein